jgi:hypothetical protein
MYPEMLKENDHRSGEDSTELAGALAGALFVVCAHVGAPRRITTARVAKYSVVVILQAKS